MRFLMVLAALPLIACGAVAQGSGAAAAGDTRSFPVADFTGVELAGADDIDVKVGGAFSVRAEGPAAELDKLDIRKEGSTLKVGRKRNLAGWSWSSGKGVKIHVTMPAIRAASVAGSGNMRVDTVSARDFDGSLAGSGDLTLGRLAATSASLAIAGSGGIAVAGQVQQLKISIAGSGDVDAAALNAARADMSIAGSGNIAAQVNGPASVNIMGSGDVTLSGKPQCTISKMGSGSVKCG